MLKIIIIALGAVAGSVQAQEETLFGEDLKSRGYGGPAVHVASLFDATHIMIGGWIIDHTFVIGGGYGAIQRIDISNETSGSLLYEARMGYGGLLPEYVYVSDKLMHVFAYG